MYNPFVNKVGGVVSADIAVPEHERELDFYSKVLTAGDQPLWRPDLSNNRGAPIIGLGVRTPEYSNLPLQWMPHFQVADVGASVSNAIEMGGSAIMQSDTDDVASQWAALFDQHGVAFGVIPVAPDSPEYIASGVGRIAGLSLFASDTVSTSEFYQKVIGYDAKPGEGANFEMLIENGNTAATIVEKSSEDSEIPSVWLIHLPVRDLGKSLQQVRDNKGEVVKSSTDFAIVRDPVDVHFAMQQE